MIKPTVEALAEVLKKAFSLFMIMAFLCLPVFSQDTWIENKKYIDEKFNNIEKSNGEIKTDLKAYRDEIKVYTDKQNKLELENVKTCGEINTINKSIDYLNKIVYGMGGLIGGSALFGGGAAIRNQQRKKRINLKKSVEDSLLKQS